jgi:hypothetical protein
VIAVAALVPEDPIETEIAIETETVPMVLSRDHCHPHGDNSNILLLRIITATMIIRTTIAIAIITTITIRVTTTVVLDETNLDSTRHLQDSIHIHIHNLDGAGARCPIHPSGTRTIPCCVSLSGKHNSRKKRIERLRVMMMLRMIMLTPTMMTRRRRRRRTRVMGVQEK